LHRERSSSIAIIGASTRGVSLVERIGASAPELLAGRNLDIYLIDPYPAGPGRVWRYDQPLVLQANSIAANLTMFTDSTVECDGPILPGPSLPEWANIVRAGVYDVPDAPELAEELAELGEWSYASRRLVSVYLAWAFGEIKRRLPGNVALHVIEDKAVDVTDLATGQQSVRLADHGEVVVDVVLLALGHLDAKPTIHDTALQEFAADRKLFYAPPAYSADVELDPIRPGETVIIRGLGLAFIDFTAMLTEGRGGVFRDREDGRLDYVPSGMEPVIVAGSRRGVPHHGKPNYRLTTAAPVLPRFLDAEQLAVRKELDYACDVAPLVAKEIAWTYYHELLQRRRDEHMPLKDFEPRFAAASWGSPEMRSLLAEAVPDARDHFALDALTHPLGSQCYDPEQLQERVRDYIENDVARRSTQRYSADLRLVYGVESALAQVSTDLVLSRLHPRDIRTHIDTHLTSLSKEVGSGPPAARLRQLVALSEAGVLRFLGAGMWVETDEAAGMFRAGSTSSPEVFEAKSLIEARLPDATVSRSEDPLLRALYLRGEVVEQVLTGPDGESYARGQLVVNPSDGRVITAAGVVHPRRYALGSYTTSGAQAAFIFPGQNSLILRQNDAAVRQLLMDLADQRPTTDEGRTVWSNHVPDHDRRSTAGVPGAA